MQILLDTFPLLNHLDSLNLSEKSKDQTDKKSVDKSPLELSIEEYTIVMHRFINYETMVLKGINIPPILKEDKYNICFKTIANVFTLFNYYSCIIRLNVCFFVIK